MANWALIQNNLVSGYTWSQKGCTKLGYFSCNTSDNVARGSLAVTWPVRYISHFNFQLFALWLNQQLENIVQHGRHSVHHGRDHKRLGVITCEELQSVNCLSGKKIAIFSHHCGLTQHLLILWTMTRKKTTTKRNKTGDKVFCCYGDNISNLLFLFFGVSLPLLWIHQILYLLDFCQVLRMRTQKFSLYLQ